MQSKWKTRNHLENFPKTIKLYIDESKMKELIDKKAEKRNPHKIGNRFKFISWYKTQICGG